MDRARLGDQDDVVWLKRNSGDAVRGKPDDIGRGKCIVSGSKSDFRCLSTFFAALKCMVGMERRKSQWAFD